MNANSLSSAAAIPLLFGTSLAVAAPVYIQPADQFSAALNNTSTSPSFVMVTAVDQQTGSTRTGCIPAPFLIGAIEREDDLVLGSPQAEQIARQIAMSHPDHIYTFKKPDALKNMAFNNEGGRYAIACKIIQSGRPARMTDRAGLIVGGQP